MKKTSSKKGFSLIELIVVIAVIAAIAAVIVPSITNFNQEAKNTADKRNVQLWNQTYLEASSAGADVSKVKATSGVAGAGGADAFSVNTMVGDTKVFFNAPAFTIAGNQKLTYTADANPPLSLAATKAP